MKKDRNCGATPYPVYQPYPQMGGFMPLPYPPNMGMPMTQYMDTQTNTSMNMSNTIEQQLNTMEQRINMLDKRITTLENMFNSSNNSLYSNNYNSSNYQML